METLRSRKSCLIEEKGYNDWRKNQEHNGLIKGKSPLGILGGSLTDDFKVISGSDGSKISDEEGIENEIVYSYKALYEDFDDSIIEQNDGNFFNGLPTIPGQGEGDICKPISVEELRAMLQMCKDS